MSDEYTYDVFPEYRYNRRDRSKIILSITVGILASFLVLIYFHHISLQLEYYDLKSEYQGLEENYLKLDSELSSLKTLRDNLLFRINQLEGEVSSLKKSYDDLLFQYQISEALRINHLLEDYYDEVRSLKNTPPRKGRDPDYSEQIKFMIELARHSLGRIYWPALEERFYELSGEYSYVMAMRKTNEVFKIIGIEDMDTPVEKVEKILRFVNDHVHYEDDYDNVFLAPLETLSFRSGDCDDYAILVATLFEKAGINSAIGIFTNGTIDHAMVLIHLYNLSPYGFHYYQDLTDIGLSPGRWILIEPQATIGRQYDPDWFNQWRLQAAAEV
ncbi:MAG: transglutaminase domain-containing protein [Thermoproteota archaeon]